MKVKLMVNWAEEEILTVKELDERIDARVEEILQNTDIYDEHLDDYLDCNYTKRELFNALAGSDAERKEVLTDIRSGITEEIHDYVSMDISDNFRNIVIEI